MISTLVDEIKDCKFLKLDGNVDIFENKDIVNTWGKEIQAFIHNK